MLKCKKLSIINVKKLSNSRCIILFKHNFIKPAISIGCIKKQQSYKSQNSHGSYHGRMLGTLFILVGLKSTFFFPTLSKLKQRSEYSTR